MGESFDISTFVLPDYTPLTEVVEAPWAGDGVFSMGMVRHPIVKGPDGRLAVDVWVEDGVTMAKVWVRADHPNIDQLPWNTPRKIRALYRADGQLAYLRSSDVFGNPAVLAYQTLDDLRMKQRGD